MSYLVYAMVLNCSTDLQGHTGLRLGKWSSRKSYGSDNFKSGYYADGMIMPPGDWNENLQSKFAYNSVFFELQNKNQKQKSNMQVKENLGHMHKDLP